MAKKDILAFVESILRKFPKTRDDDFLLYGYICYNTDADVWDKTFGYVMVNHQKLGLPSYESVTRARRKLQEIDPGLRGKKYAKRKKIQEEYREKYGRM